MTKELHTRPELLEGLRQAAHHKPTSEEVRRQKISFVIGSVKERNTLTRSYVEQVLSEQLGQN